MSRFERLNGTTKSFLWALSVILALVGGALSAGMWLGGTKQALESHVEQESIHEGEEVKNERIENFVGPLRREMDDIKGRVERIDDKTTKILELMVEGKD
jgi:hypothetical protein